MKRPYFAAAREVASSPSEWASFIDAAGLKPKGSETWNPCVRCCAGCSIWCTYLASEDLGGCVDLVDID
jgi:hypothetical protein